MKLGWQKHGPAECRIVASKAHPERLLELSGLFVPVQHRAKGWASKLLAEVGREADTDMLPLLLMVDKHKLSLVQLYNKHGFEVIQTSPECLMLRIPRAV